MRQYIKYLIIIFIMTIVTSFIGWFIVTNPIMNNPNYLLRKNGIKQSDIILEMDIINFKVCLFTDTQNSQIGLVRLSDNINNSWKIHNEERDIMKDNNIMMLPYVTICNGDLVDYYIIGGRIQNDMDIVVNDNRIARFDKCKVIDNYIYFIHDMNETKEYSLEYRK